ncbi:MAG: hypothetical protein LQ348_006412 [Seirophora lacunosa]|nr:MAG: hypothetical protein LQ344_001639 [Seirophora lacunosa]KAI4174216.1 MAG: hypothetical protein LQ348_006412 [Seirophora lacunosa]
MAKFIPRDRKARRKKDRRSRNEEDADTNAAEILPVTISEKEKQRKEIKDSLRAQQPKMSSKKSKRLNKYIDKKIRKEDTLDLIKQLEINSMNTSRRLGFAGFQVPSQLYGVGRSRVNGRKNQSLSLDDGSGYSSDESDEPGTLDKPQIEVEQTQHKNIKPVLGSGLKRPFDIGPDGNPVIPKRQRLNKSRPQLQNDTESSWEGFSSDLDSDASLDSQSSSSHSEGTHNDSDLEDGSSATSSLIGEIGDRKDAENEKMKARRRERSSAFKAWASQQVNEALGFTPSAVTLPAQIEHPERIRQNIKLREPEQDPLPPELQPIADAPARKAFSVKVNRSTEIQAARMELPIVAEEQKIMEAIYNNPTVVIWGATGSGKTTQVPQFLYEAGFGDPSSANPGMIGVTQPRRVAAVSMAKRVSDELGGVSGKVSYQIRFESSVGYKTAIKFMTDGILIREIATDFALLKYSVIVIDEAHERSTNTDILIGMVSRIVDLRMSMSRDDAKIKPLKLVIMSATLRISDFLENPKLFRDGPPPLLQAEGRQYAVTTHFARRTQRDYLEEAFRKVCKGHKKLPPGGMLVFVTGQNEIVALAKRLKEAFVHSPSNVGTSSRIQIGATEAPLEMDDLDFGDDEKADRIQDEDFDDDESSDSDDNDFDIKDSAPASASIHVLPLYSQLQTKDQLKVFEPPPQGSRLIVLATNVAETSLTIPGIRYVFDCGRAKEKKYDRISGVQSFEVGWISKASASQRAGRAGRTAPGHCFRLYSSAVYERDFEEHAEPEILKMPAEGVVLQLKSMDLQHVVNFPFPTPPDRPSLAKAEKLLTYLGAISTSGKITSIGRDLSIYPLSPRFSKILLIGHQQSCMQYTIAMVAALSVAELFVPENQLDISSSSYQDAQNIYTQADRQADIAQEERRKSYNHAHHLFSRNSATSDAIKLLTALCASAYAPDSQDFCTQHHLNAKPLHEATRLRSQLHSIVRTHRPSLLAPYNPRLPQPSKTQLKALEQIIAVGFIDLIAIRADLSPSPPELPRKPSRAIDVPYFPLFPLQQGRVEDLVDKAVYIHPSSVLAHIPARELPQYIVYSHLQKGTPATIEGAKKVKTRMHALTSLTGKQIAALAQGTPLLEYGKPVGKVVESGQGKRECWVGFEIRGEKGKDGWPLGATRVVQSRRHGEWVVEKVLE